MPARFLRLSMRVWLRVSASRFLARCALSRWLVTPPWRCACWQSGSANVAGRLIKRAGRVCVVSPSHNSAPLVLVSTIASSPSALRRSPSPNSSRWRSARQHRSRHMPDTSKRCSTQRTSAKPRALKRRPERAKLQTPPHLTPATPPETPPRATAYAAAYAAYAAYTANPTAAAAAAAAAADAYAYAANAARAHARDQVLEDFAEGVVQILIEMGAPGCQWLSLTEAA
jgi:hypothetical protein